MVQHKMDAKLRKGQKIENNWNCSVQDSLPADIRPRASGRSKASIGTALPAAPWQTWSFSVLHELERLSSMTMGKLAVAQELMVLEVRQRQRDLNNHHHAAAEILLGDLQRVNGDMADNSLTNLETDDRSEGEVESEDEGDGDGSEGEKERGRLEENVDGDEQGGIKVEDDGSDLMNNGIAQGNEVAVSKIKSPTRKTRTDTSNGNGLSLAMMNNPVSYDVRKKQAKILRLRADAMRLKQEASKRLAEAYELEAKMMLEGGS